MSEQTVLAFRPFLKATHYQLHTGLYAAAFEAERESLHSSIRRLFYTVAKHIGLWDVKTCPPSVWRARPPPRANALPKYELSIDYSDSQLPVSDNLSRAPRP